MAQVIAQAAGAGVTPAPLRPELHAVLLTGSTPRYLSARAGAATGYTSEVTEAPGWSPPTLGTLE